MKALWTLSVMALMLTPTARGDDTPNDGYSDVDCSVGGQTEMTLCFGEAYQAADAKLNQVYQSLKVRLSDTERDKLLHEERAWIKERDKKCVEDADDDPQNDASPGYHLQLSAFQNSCKLEMTKVRIKTIEERLKALPAPKP